jgi:hypothetical protein
MLAASFSGAQHPLAFAAHAAPAVGVMPAPNNLVSATKRPPPFPRRIWGDLAHERPAPVRSAQPIEDMSHATNLCLGKHSSGPTSEGGTQIAPDKPRRSVGGDDARVRRSQSA